MFYTTEEAAIVCGFLNLYLDRARGLSMGGECSLLSEALLVAVT